MNEFKIGDTVRCIKPSIDWKNFLNEYHDKIVTISNIKIEMGEMFLYFKESNSSKAGFFAWRFKKVINQQLFLFEVD